MPRAFLLTHRRYPPVSKDIKSEDEEDDPRHHPKENVSQGEEFFNLTQLAEVSLAAAQIEVNATTKEVSLKIASNLGKENREFFQCNECGKKYTTSSNLARHRQVHRDINDKKAKKCPQCGKTYVSVPAYSMHIRTHNQDCRCHICGKGFSRPWLLQGHIRTHTGEKPFKCSICDKAFADRSNLRAHVQTHSNKKPHVCQRCGKAFALKSYLYKHEEASCVRVTYYTAPRNSDDAIVGLQAVDSDDAATTAAVRIDIAAERKLCGGSPTSGFVFVNKEAIAAAFDDNHHRRSYDSSAALEYRPNKREETRSDEDQSSDKSGPTDFRTKGQGTYRGEVQGQSKPHDTTFEPIITVAVPFLKSEI